MRIPSGAAMNRRRVALRLRQYVRVAQWTRRIKSWWSTIKELVFFPPTYSGESRPCGNPCHAKSCRVRQDLWNKWDVKELRTSNIAESFTRLLSVLLRVKHALMSKLILALQDCVSDAKGALLYLEAHRTKGKRIRRRDILRRRSVAKETNRFKSALNETRGLLRTVVITTYCLGMSRLEKAL